MTNPTDTYNHPRHPAYLRVWLYAMDHNGQTLNPCQLRDATNLDARTLSRGLTTARKLHLITADSHARCLTAALVPGVTT